MQVGLTAVISYVGVPTCWMRKCDVWLAAGCSTGWHQQPCMQVRVPVASCSECEGCLLLGAGCSTGWHQQPCVQVRQALIPLLVGVSQLDGRRGGA
jgi:hypothetical protein